MRKFYLLVSLVVLGVVIFASGKPTDISATIKENIMSMPKQPLSSKEVEAILWMREEEKLARDVYITLYEIWKLPIFINISKSEQTHTDAVKALIEKYGLSDPVKSNKVGEFSNKEIKKLYDQLVEQVKNLS